MGEEGGHPGVLPTMRPRSRPGVPGTRAPGVSTAPRGLRRLVQPGQSDAAVGSLPQYPRAPEVPSPGGRGGGASLGLPQLHVRCHFLKRERRDSGPARPVGADRFGVRGAQPGNREEEGKRPSPGQMRTRQLPAPGASWAHVLPGVVSAFFCDRLHLRKFRDSGLSA